MEFVCIEIIGDIPPTEVANGNVLLNRDKTKFVTITDSRLNENNRKLLFRYFENGDYYPSDTREFCYRLCDISRVKNIYYCSKIIPQSINGIKQDIQ